VNQRDRLNTKTIDLDRALVEWYQDAGRALRLRGGRALIEEAMRNFQSKVEARIRKRKPPE
jgi:hypothetical protein